MRTVRRAISPLSLRLGPMRTKARVGEKRAQKKTRTVVQTVRAPPTLGGLSGGSFTGSFQ
jgi:hypothetical protein